MNVSVANPTDVCTLMNAYSPPPGQQLATINFLGTGGVSLTFPRIAGQDIRDYGQGAFANTLTNGVAGVQALNAFTRDDPADCLGSRGTGNVQTGRTGTYVVDEQDFSLGAAFAGQTLTQIIITDTNNGSVPILLGITVGSAGMPSVSTGGIVSASRIAAPSHYKDVSSSSPALIPKAASLFMSGIMRRVPAPSVPENFWYGLL